MIGISKTELTTKPLRQSLALNPDVVGNLEKTQTAGSPATIVNAPFMIASNLNSVDYTIILRIQWILAYYLVDLGLVFSGSWLTI